MDIHGRFVIVTKVISFPRSFTKESGAEARTISKPNGWYT